MRDICFVADLWGAWDIWKTSSGNDVLLMTNMCWQTTPPSLAKAKTKTNKGTNKGNHRHRHKDAYAMDGIKTYYYLSSSTDKKYFLIDGLHHDIIDLFCHYYLQSVVQSCLNLMHLMGFNVIGLRSYDFAERVPHQTIMSHFFLNLLKMPGLLLGRITVGLIPELSEPRCLRMLKAMSHCNRS